MRHQGAGALGQARAHGRLGLRARRGQLERRIKRGKTAEDRRKIGQARHIRDNPATHMQRDLALNMAAHIDRLVHTAPQARKNHDFAGVIFSCVITG